MPKNSTCTLGSAALKLQDGYVATTHDMFNYATYTHSDGTSFRFSKENKLLRTINALDYVPLIFFMNTIPVSHIPVCKQVQIRRSARTHKPTAKYESYLKNQTQSFVPPKDVVLPKITILPPEAQSSLQHKKLDSIPKRVSSPPPDATPPSSDPPGNTSCKKKCVEHLLQIPSNQDTSVQAVENDVTEVKGYLSSLLIHLKFECRNHRTLKHMHLTQALAQMPPVVLQKTPCPICLLVKNTRLKKNKETSMGNFVPGELMMMDFAYFSVTSIRGYVDYFSITCQATGNGLCFCRSQQTSTISSHCLDSWSTEETRSPYSSCTF